MKKEESTCSHWANRKMMKRLVYIAKHFWDIVYSIYINLKAFPLITAFKCPLMVHHSVVIKGLEKDIIKIESDTISPFMIQIGIGGAEGIADYRKSCLVLSPKTKLIFYGKAALSRGISIRAQIGTIVFGRNFFSNCNTSIICEKKVSFGHDVLLGWDISIRDCDGHNVYVDEELSNSAKEVHIGDHVWIGARADILKGVAIPSGSIVAYRSCVLHSFDEENILIAGYPAKKIKSNVRWEV